MEREKLTLGSFLNLIEHIDLNNSLDINVGGHVYISCMPVECKVDYLLHSLNERMLKAEVCAFLFSQSSISVFLSSEDFSAFKKTEEEPHDR